MLTATDTRLRPGPERQGGLGMSLRSATMALLTVFVFTIPSSSTLIVSPAFGTLTRAVGVAMVVPAILAVLLDGRQYRLHDVHLLLFALLLLIVTSFYWSIDPQLTASLSRTSFELVILVLLIWEFGSGEGRWERVLAAFVAGCWVGALQIVVAALSGQEWGDGRFTAATFNPGELAAILVLGVPAAWYLGLRWQHAASRALARLYLPVGFMAILLTGSRATLVALPVALTVVPLTVRRLPPGSRVLLAAVVAAAGLLAAQVVPEDTVARLQTLTTEVEEGDLNGRAQLWSTTADVISDNLAVGTGAGALRTAIERRTANEQSAHNTYLAVGAELGLVGLTLFLLILLAAGLQASTFPHLQRIYALVTLATLMVVLSPTHSHFAKITWLTVAMVVAPSAAARWRR